MIVDEDQIQEAQRILAVRECGQYGHDLVHVFSGESNNPISMFCERCGVTYKVERLT